MIGIAKLHSAVYIYRAMKKRDEEMLTTNEIMQRLEAPYQTVVSWIKKGLFPNAKREETPRGPVWYVPAGDVEAFERPPMGRPPKPKPKGRRKG